MADAFLKSSSHRKNKELKAIIMIIHNISVKAHTGCSCKKGAATYK